jgi:tryptophan halogenase
MNFAILGGGSAGWITALFVKHLFPNDSVTVVQSPTVGIIGVGEATTSHAVTFFKSIGLDPIDLLRNTNGTVKNGNNFVNWAGKGTRYFHTFSENIVDFSIPGVFDGHCREFYLKNLIKNKLSFEEYLYQTKLAYANKIDLQNTGWAIQIDARDFAAYLEKFGKNKGIDVIEGTYTHPDQDEQGNITALNLDGDRSVLCDFVFDCTGFARLLIGKLYKESWVSYKKYMPMKRAVMFWLDPDKDIPSYTSSIAMDAGWILKIPLQHRSGSGYVYDSDQITEEQALVEAAAYWNRPLDIKKSLIFDTGRYERVWVKNCLAVGLSTGFIEPLEATSLWSSLQQLDFFRHFINELKTPKASSIRLYNKLVSNHYEEKMEYVYMHYCTKRTDTEFWRNFTKNYPMPENLVEKFELIKENNLRHFDIDRANVIGHFSLYSYLQTCSGLGMFTDNIDITGYENIQPSPIDYKRITDFMLSKAVNHTEFLNSLKTGK